MSMLIVSDDFTLMNVSDAAIYVGIPQHQMLLAVDNHELPVLHPTDPDGERMLRTTDLDLWALWSLGRPAASRPAVSAG